MDKLKAEFVDSINSPLKYFQLVREPNNPVGNVVFVQGMFEELNQNRHVFKYLGLQLAAQNIRSVIFDFIGTGDSEGDLYDVSLPLWQSQLNEVVDKISKNNRLPISLVVFGSGALTLSDDIISKCHYIQLWQPEFSGKKLLKQLSRIAILNKMPIDESGENIDVAGYQLPQSLWLQLKNATPFDLVSKQSIFDWLELIDSDEQPIPTARTRAAQTVFGESFKINALVQSKYWQANELILPQKLLEESVAKITQEHCENGVE